MSRLAFVFPVAMLCMCALAFTPSNVIASGFYVDAGMSASAGHDQSSTQTVLVATPSAYADGSTRYALEYFTFKRYQPYDVNVVRNPYGALAFGYDWRWRSWAIDLQARHESSINAGDRGRESVSLNLRWYPFGQR